MEHTTAVFFDLDNTLIATRRADERTCDKLREILNRKYSLSINAAAQICKRYLKMFRKCPDNPPMDLDAWRKILWTDALGEHSYLTDDIYQQWLTLRYEYLSLAPDITHFLKTLRKSHLLALITNGPSQAQWEKVEKLDLKSYFDLILVSGDLPWEKPSAEIFLEACETLAVDPKHCVMIGDKLETDILGGSNAKLLCSVWVPLGSRQLREGDPLPDFVVEKVTDFSRLLPQIVKRKSKIFSNVSLADVDDCNSNGSDGS
ncbi:unnamed protein product [Phaedon cochleariae]|uniref:N-acylneuraminate-9-phosphatase n=1 Tax=Phaedon cochleariae TaxID=80249 RepID=A0A9N9X0H9_PHACE|nr:unnamed protein product [Phaedon cochleariae]